ncbi:hypothetical protein [Variovorax sp. OV700]|uniref:hypothetical protein n=1 Tax=Variovorax sp. OV700 TaxID=1882826 RepID=UPI000881AF6D|nr:hypothetical protein [Variovorax sp. OV700]SDJ82350.1 hypothetical protein SAMN05444748_1273 [Variovorax sp. OV700]
MYEIDLIADCKGTENLASFAVSFFDAIGIEVRQERESENYTGGTYYVGSGEGLKVNISISDDPQHEAMPYWIVVSTDDALALEDRIRERLLPRGFQVARVMNFGEPTEYCKLY